MRRQSIKWKIKLKQFFRDELWSSEKVDYLISQHKKRSNCKWNLHEAFKQQPFLPQALISDYFKCQVQLKVLEFFITKYS